MPIVLATFVLSSDVTHTNTIFNAVFFVVVVSVIVQGTTLEWVAGRLGLLSAAPPVHEAPLEVGHLSKLDLVDFVVASNHAIAGSAVRELGLPRDALIAVITRGDDTIPPRGIDRGRAGRPPVRARAAREARRPRGRLLALAPTRLEISVSRALAVWSRFSASSQAALRGP